MLNTPLKDVNLTTNDLQGIRLSGGELQGAIISSLQAVDLIRIFGRVHSRLNGPFYFLASSISKISISSAIIGEGFYKMILPELGEPKASNVLSILF